jgi:hypothetical protein
MGQRKTGHAAGTAVLQGTLVVCLAGTLLAQGSQTLTVSAQMDIWQSGGYSDGSDGVPPAAYAFAAAPGQSLTFFPNVTGYWTCSDSAAAYGPDGTTVVPCASRPNNYSPTGPFSGLKLTDFQGPMVGMFLEDTLPVSVPPTLRFYTNDSQAGGIKTNFEVLSPQIGQVFFIGDGNTWTGGGGAVQLFQVPPTATHLYLGYADSCDAATPGCYSDTKGSISATFAISQCSFQVSGVSPQEQTPDRLWAVQAGMMLSWKSGKSIGGTAAASIADSVAPATTEFATDYADGASGCVTLDNCSISLPDYTNFLERLGITEVDKATSACGLTARLRKFGPMTIVIGTPTPNVVEAEVLTGITGDGTASGAGVNYIDSITGTAKSGSLETLLLSIEPALAAGWPEFVQFP